MIHPMAVVHADCWIGQGSEVWQFASVIRKARIGAGSSVAGCAIVDGSRLGPGARIGHGAQLHPGVVAGRNLFLGPGAIVCNDPWPWLGAQDFDLQALIEGRQVAVIIEELVSIGAGAIVLPGVRLGAGCMVAAGAVVSADVPAGQLLTRAGDLMPLPEPGRRMRFAA